ncbi:HSF-type DNA-binding-domain-containing protein [Paraphysoderma sedebokerense]|nr:HSF-type DNA-binding-domain-containing protein [Paraphysoderma sedebokerense]
MQDQKQLQFTSSLLHNIISQPLASPVFEIPTLNLTSGMCDSINMPPKIQLTSNLLSVEPPLTPHTSSSPSSPNLGWTIPSSSVSSNMNWMGTTTGTSPNFNSTLPTATVSPTLTGVTDYRTSNRFVHKLYRILNEEANQRLIFWSGCGTSFIVEDIASFSKEILPNYFRHGNFTSFVRQLNMYGFQKVTNGLNGRRTDSETGRCEFFHPCFLADRPDLLDQVKRRKDNDYLSHDAGDLANAISMLHQKNAQLSGRIQMLENRLNLAIEDLYRQRGIVQRLQDLLGANVHSI